VQKLHLEPETNEHGFWEWKRTLARVVGSGGLTDSRVLPGAKKPCGGNRRMGPPETRLLDYGQSL